MKSSSQLRQLRLRRSFGTNGVPEEVRLGVRAIRNVVTDLEMMGLAETESSYQVLNWIVVTSFLSQSLSDIKEDASTAVH